MPVTRKRGLKAMTGGERYAPQPRGGGLNLLIRLSRESAGTGGFFAISIHQAVMPDFFGTSPIKVAKVSP